MGGDSLRGRHVTPALDSKVDGTHPCYEATLVLRVKGCVCAVTSRIVIRQPYTLQQAPRINMKRVPQN
ncbi:hypothetical protein HPP92_017650 [Vanilla planifolia]|uniref:Uncharacterized protein n=1 Tax=Vanilla planifolia TaxID=51239 RepID=A0A835Q4C4_VANPL|nr:hypothetical protein HPP92_017650 [Vanilla planifolia]